MCTIHTHISYIYVMYVRITDCSDLVSRIQIMPSDYTQSILTHPPLSVPVLSLVNELDFVDCCHRHLPTSLKMAVARRSVLTRPHRAAATEGRPMRAQMRFCLLVLSTSTMSCRMRSVFCSWKPFSCERVGGGEKVRIYVRR